MGLNMTNLVPVLLLLLLQLLAFDSMWGFIFRNGYYDALVRLRDIGPHLLPGSDTPLQEQYIGIGPVDYWLTVLQAVFANIFDGSAPELSMYAFYFAGQLGAVITVLCVESCREGNEKMVLALFLPWASVMQSIGYGIIMPTYCGVHLLMSPTASSEPSRIHKSVHPRGDPTLDTLPWSILCGYILPAVMMSLPCFSPTVHQCLVAVWQVFPVWILTLQYIFGKASCLVRGPRQSISRTSGTYMTDRESLNQVYRFAFTLATLTHCITLGLIGLVQYFPALMPTSSGHAVTIQDVFLPPNFWTRTQISDMVQGAHGFCQYDQYVGSIAVIVWAMTPRFNVRGKSMSAREWVQLASEVVGYGMVAGTAGALVMLLWVRDIEAMNGEGDRNGVKKTS